MDVLVRAFESLRDFVPALAVLAAVAMALTLAGRLLAARGRRSGSTLAFARPLLMLALTALGIVAVIVALPLGETTRGQLLSLLGLLLTAILTLSSTSFVANAMAGLMLRGVRNYHLRNLGECFLIDDDFMQRFSAAPAGIADSPEKISMPRCMNSRNSSVSSWFRPAGATPATDGCTVSARGCGWACG